MAQHLTITVLLGAGLAGQLANIRAQLKDEADVAVGGLIGPSGFTEVGTKGVYKFHYAAYPDGFEGSVDFSISGTVWTSVGINDADFGAAGTAEAAATAAAVWGALRSGYLAAGTFGEAFQIPRSGTAQAGSSTTITLDAGASAVNDFYLEADVFLIAGTGAGQTRVIEDYVGATKVATVNTAWATAPDNTSRFIILPRHQEHDELGDVASSVWSFGSRTLTQSLQSIVDAIEDAGRFRRRRGDTWTIGITGLGSLVGRDKLYFTLKGSEEDADADAVLQIEETAGLLRLNGAAGTAGHGAIVVDDEDDGDITVTVQAAATVQIPRESRRFDVQMVDGATVTTPGEGILIVEGHLTHAIT